VKKLKLKLTAENVLSETQMKKINGGYDQICQHCCRPVLTTCACSSDEAVQALDSNPYA